MVLDDAPNPVSIFDRNGFVYMYDPVRGMYIFDYYGAMKKRLDLMDWADVQVIGDQPVGRKDGKLLRYRAGSVNVQETELPIPLRQAAIIQIAPQGVYVLEKEGISLYVSDAR
jgi:hypothetical protein